jgi:uncharacterized protein
MAHVTVHDPEVELDDPWLVEGLPGVGLVGKIAVDHLVDELGMDHYADVACDGLPDVGVYAEDDYAVRQPVRVYVDEARDLLALQSDVPVSPSAATEFAACVTNWLAENGVTPAYLSGIPVEDRTDPPSLFGVATGDGGALLTEVGVSPPGEAGVVSGPTGALVNQADTAGLSGVALVVESDPQFPDPTAARVVIRDGIGPLTGADVDLADLVDRAEEIQDAKEKLAKRMEAAREESSKAEPLGMYR